MGRTPVALIAVALLGTPFVGYAGMQLLFGNAPPAPQQQANLVAERSVTPPATTGGVGQPPTKRVVTAITISDTDELKTAVASPVVHVAEAGAASDPIAAVIEGTAEEPAVEDRAPTPQTPGEMIKKQRDQAEPTVAEAAPQAADGCVPIDKVTDRDGDFKRNAKGLEGLCIIETTFKENGVDWVIHTVRARKGGPLWAVPHDNEDAAFDSAVWALNTYGGVMVSVETGGERENRGIDPNRNFTGNATACGRTSPRFTAAFLDQMTPGQPIVGLHSNTPKGNVSINGKLPNTTPHRAPKPNPFIKAKSDEDTLVFVASLKPDGEDAVVDGFVKRLLDDGINVMREHVTAKGNDCSFSNYAALKGLSGYYNVEVVHGDGAAQRRLIELLMKV